MPSQLYYQIREVLQISWSLQRTRILEYYFFWCSILFHEKLCLRSEMNLKTSSCISFCYTSPVIVMNCASVRCCGEDTAASLPRRALSIIWRDCCWWEQYCVFGIPFPNLGFSVKHSKPCAATWSLPLSLWWAAVENWRHKKWRSWVEIGTIYWKEQWDKKLEQQFTGKGEQFTLLNSHRNPLTIPDLCPCHS